MSAWVNIIIVISASFLCLYFYVKSVSPAALERRVGDGAYRKCYFFRIIACVFMFIMAANYVVYRIYPLPIPIAQRFPWSWWISALMAVLIGIPCGYLLWRGMKDAGEALWRSERPTGAKFETGSTCQRFSE